jgi:predicted transporter
VAPVADKLTELPLHIVAGLTLASTVGFMAVFNNSVVEFVQAPLAPIKVNVMLLVGATVIEVATILPGNQV